MLSICFLPTYKSLITLGLTRAAQSSVVFSKISPWLVAFHCKAISPLWISFHHARKACPLAATFPGYANAHGSLTLSHVCRGV